MTRKAHMKTLAAIALTLSLTSCSTLGTLLDVPGAVVEDVGGAVDSVLPSPEAEAIGTAAGDVAGIITGNPLVDVAVTAIVAGIAGWFIRKKKAA